MAMVYDIVYCVLNDLQLFTDHVFDTSATTGTVYAKLAEPIVLGVMEGINGTIHLYES